MSDRDFIRLSTDVTGSIPVKVQILEGTDALSDPTIVIENDSPGSAKRGTILTQYPLSVMREAAKANMELPLTEKAGGFATEKVIGQLAMRGVMTCIEFALDQKIKSLRLQLGKPETPVVVMKINGGVINETLSTKPVRVIVLDEDTEGADEDRIAEVQGEEVYVHDIEIAEPRYLGMRQIKEIVRDVDDFQATSTNQPSER